MNAPDAWDPEKAEMWRICQWRREDMRSGRHPQDETPHAASGRRTRPPGFQDGFPPPAVGRSLGIWWPSSSMWQPEAKKMAKYADVIWDAQCQVIVILELSHRDIYLPINWGKGKRRGWRREGKGVCIEKASGKGILEHTYISACKYGQP